MDNGGGTATIQRYEPVQRQLGSRSNVVANLKDARRMTPNGDGHAAPWVCALVIDSNGRGWKMGWMGWMDGMHTVVTRKQSRGAACQGSTIIMDFTVRDTAIGV
jgi:hypothetical protein